MGIVKSVGKVMFGICLTLCGVATVSIPAAAGSVGISFGWYGPGYVPFGDPCAYYDYYDTPPPWGLPPDYCDYPVYFGTVFWDGIWYRGPIYYRWYSGERMFWINGGWHRDNWRGGRPPQIVWRERGGERANADRHFEDRMGRFDVKKRPAAMGAEDTRGREPFRDRETIRERDDPPLGDRVLRAPREKDSGRHNWNNPAGGGGGPGFGNPRSGPKPPSGSKRDGRR